MKKGIQILSILIILGTLLPQEIGLTGFSAPEKSDLLEKEEAIVESRTNRDWRDTEERIVQDHQASFSFRDFKYTDQFSLGIFRKVRRHLWVMCFLL
ncbi:MAG: hypothetical protein JXQ96_16825 [Cyclobacteriaceae bacterium]